MSSSIGPTTGVGLRPDCDAASPRRSQVWLATWLPVLPLAAVMAGTAFVAVTAFVLAYDGSRGAAADAGISQSDWYPFCIEGVIVCASVATLRLRDCERWRQRALPWLILLVFTAVSVAANVLHAWEQPGWQWWSLAFAAVPPLALPICVHLLLMVGRPRGTQVARNGGKVRREVADAGGSGPLEPESDPSAQPANGNGNGRGNGGGQSKTERALAAALAFEAQNHRLPSQAELIELTGPEDRISNGTAGNVLKPLRNLRKARS